MARNRNKRVPLLVSLLGLTVILALGYQVGLAPSIDGTVKVLAFLRNQTVNIFFLIATASVLAWILKLNFSDDPELEHFVLWKLLAHPDGSPNPKNISLWLATLAGMYAFFYLLMNDRTAFTSFANWFLLTLFGYAGAIEIFKQKEPPAVPGTIVTTEKSEVKKTTEVSTKPPLGEGA